MVHGAFRIEMQSWITCPLFDTGVLDDLIRLLYDSSVILLRSLHWRRAQLNSGSHILGRFGENCSLVTYWISWDLEIEPNRHPDYRRLIKTCFRLAWRFQHPIKNVSIELVPKTPMSCMHILNGSRSWQLSPLYSCLLWLLSLVKKHRALDYPPCATGLSDSTRMKCHQSIRCTAAYFDLNDFFLARVAV